MTFIDWNGNGRRNDSVDNLMDFLLISNLSKGGRTAITAADATGLAASICCCFRPG